MASVARVGQPGKSDSRSIAALQIDGRAPQAGRVPDRRKGPRDSVAKKESK